MKLRVAALAAVLSLVALACGQKPGVHARAMSEGQAGIPGAGVGVGTGAVLDPTTGQYVDPTTGQVVDATTGAPVSGTTTTGGTATTTTGGAGGGGSSSSNAPTGPGDRTGIYKDKIVIGLHAPVNGAAPVQSKSFETGRDLYWRYGNNGKPVRVFGKRVEVSFRDDEYNPSTATQRCKQMAEGNPRAFLLIGGAGTDQIHACAKYAHGGGIPYLSAGVVQNNLASFPNYFALSMTYYQQGKLLGNYIKQNRNNGNWKCDGACDKVALVITNTANFDDAINGFREAYGNNFTLIRPGKRHHGFDYASRLCTATTKNFDVVYPLTSPTFFLEMMGDPSASCNPQYVGVGISMGLDTVASTGCKSSRSAMNGSIFFSPAPAFTRASGSLPYGKKDPVFNRYGRDDIHWLLWGLMKHIHQMFEKAGPDMSRQSFMSKLSTSRIKADVFPALRYSQSNHFGASSAWILRAVCEGSGGYYITVGKVGS